MFDRLLVPLDGSPLAEAALPIACELAEKFQSTIYLLQVIEQHFIPANMRGQAYAEMAMDGRPDKQEEATAYIAKVHTELLKAGFNVHGFVKGGTPVHEAVLALADDEQIDAIVMNTHGRTGLRRLVYGSVAAQLLRHSHLPIVLTRVKETPAPKFAWQFGSLVS